MQHLLRKDAGKFETIIRTKAMQTWSKPKLQRYDIAAITKLGFATNCDGGIAPDVIDGEIFGCPP